MDKLYEMNEWMNVVGIYDYLLILTLSLVGLFLVYGCIDFLALNFPSTGDAMSFPVYRCV